MNIGFQIKLALRRADKTQKQLARALNCAQPTISEYISGRIKISEEIIKKIEDYLNCKLLNGIN